MDLDEQLSLLNPQPGERFSANHMVSGTAKMWSVVLTPDLIPNYIDKLPLNADIWIGVNPVNDDVPASGRRGNAREITRLTSLFADLDVKEGGCSDYGKAMEIVCSLADILGEEPTMIVHSGHGMQPYWAIDPSENWPNPQLAALLTRWGALVRIVARSLGAEVDSVFDLPRILRAVGTLNNKRLKIDGHAVAVTGETGSGGPLTLSQIAEKLDEYGVPEVEAGSEDDFTGQSDPASWEFASCTCQYVKAAVEGWRSEMPGTNGRHPWVHGKAIRLAAFYRNGCLTGADYDVACSVLRQRFESFCVNGIGGTARPLRPKEFDESVKDARRYVAMMSDERLVREVNHLHEMGTPRQDYGPTNSGAPQAYTEAVADDPEPGAVEDDPHRDELFERIFEAEADFWYATDNLKLIFEASMARLCSPWAVLAYCAARALTLIPPEVTLPPIVGGKGSLNWFAALADNSGGGKSSAASVAKELVAPPRQIPGGLFPEDMVREKAIGSGEGMIGQFHKPPAKKGDPPEIHTSVMFVADEIDSLTAMGQRSGSTTLSIIRTAFTGGTIGFSYIARGRDVHVHSHTYRMTLIANVQPARAAGLFGDAGGGTPQRFMWFPASDPRLTFEGADHEKFFQEIDLPQGFAFQQSYPMDRGHLVIPSEARDLIVRERVKASQGRTDALDGHALFCREKFAFALAVIDGRLSMSLEDWRLSGIAAEVSTRTREWTQAKLAESLEVEAADEGRMRGVVSSASEEEKIHQNAKKSDRVQAWILKRLKTIGPHTQTELSRACAGRDKAWLVGAVEALSLAGLIRRDDENRWAVG